MPKLDKLMRGKKKESQRPVPAAVPAGPPKSERELLLEARQKGRAERKEKRGQRQAAAAAQSQKRDALKASQKSKKPQLSRAEQDAKDVQLGCCYNLTQFIARAIHFVDFVIGILAIIYGAVIDFTSDNPATEVAIACIAYGCVLVITSLMGVVGFAYPLCKRCGLQWSIYVAPLIITFYFFLVIFFLANNDEVFAYLDEHKDSMYLNEESLAQMKSLMWIPYCVLAGLAVAEMIRFCIVRQVREKLVRYDAASARIAASSRYLTDPLLGEA